MRPLLPLLLSSGLALLAGPAAADVAWSGFATLGYAVSDQDFTYQRFIKREGTFSRDTLFGLQADARLGPQWSATAQLKLAPAADHDSRWDATVAWAFVAWRPSDDWLLRAGRLRVPMFLRSESMDVGQTHDMARLPTELYSIIPTTDFDGGFISRSWAPGNDSQRDITLDAYSGVVHTVARFWLTDGLPPAAPAGANFWPAKLRVSGLALTLRQRDLLLRTSLTSTAVSRRDGVPVATDYPYVALGPGMGYYQVDPALPGPGVPTTNRAHNTLFSLGAEAGLGSGWRTMAEVVRNVQHDTPFGADATAGYVALFKQINRFAPYASLSGMTSRQAGFDWYRRLTDNPLPAAVPGADMINAAQRAASQSYWLTTQTSLALGSSYALSPDAKLKAEWLHTRIGRVSRLAESGPGQPLPHDTSVNVLSVNLSVVF